MANFPLVAQTLVFNPNNVSTQAVGLVRGCRYRVVADGVCHLTYSGTAAQYGGMIIPANFPQEFAFGMDDSQGTNVKVYVWMAAGAGRVYFTPLMNVSVG